MRKLLTLALVGLGAQLVDGTLGMAYGVTSTTLLLSTGLAPAAASASVHLAELGTTLASGTAHWRFGNVDWGVVRRIGVPGAVGGFLGATVLSSLSTEVAKPWMAGILLALGVYILLRFTARPPRHTSTTPLRKRFLAPLGIFAGFVDSTGGGGWGPVATPALLSSGRMEPRKVIGTVDTSEFLVAAAASLGFLIGLRGERVSALTVGALLAGGLIAAPIAAFLVHKIPARLLGSSVGGLIIVTNARTMLSAFDVTGSGRTLTYVALYALWAGALAVSFRGLANDRRREAAAAAEAEAAGRAEPEPATV